MKNNYLDILLLLFNILLIIMSSVQDKNSIILEQLNTIIYKHIHFILHSLSFCYLITNETTLINVNNNHVQRMFDNNYINDVRCDEALFGYHITPFIKELSINYKKYVKLYKNKSYIHIPIHIKIPLQNKIQLLYLEYNEIQDKLIELKSMFRQFIISKYNECLKYLEYAEEECLSQEKLLVTLSKINKYDIYLDNLTTNIIMSPIQKHTFCISTHINCDIIFPIHKKIYDDFMALKMFNIYSIPFINFISF